MRLDVYLRNSRLVKRRTVAQRYCEEGAVRVNGQWAKPSKTIKINDIIEIYYPAYYLKVKVKDLPKKPLPKKSQDLPYQILKNERIEQAF